ncbi:MAG: MFS transporter [Betaproteobacteria bacterium]|nr:MFS transporter [Betaproteobacteria bacterium]
MSEASTHRFTGMRLVALVCIAQVFVQLGAYFWPALLPQMMPLWQLTNSEAGWITAMFYGTYLVAVPILVTLTDRIDARLVYLFGVACTVTAHLLFGLIADGFWSALLLRGLAGIGWAGTYMTGLKLLSDHVDEKLMSRATAGHAAGVGVSGAMSFACADLLTQGFGWQAAFVVAAGTAIIAWLLVALLVPPRKAFAPRAKAGQALFDFRPVFRNRSAMAYASAYCIHTLEMNALRGWGVAFLAYVAVSTGSEARFSPNFVLTALGLLGTAASVLGNEAAIRWGRRRLIAVAMMGSITIAACLGLVGTWSYWVAVVLLLLYGFVVWLDSSSLTAGAAGTAEPSRRGATLAVHSMLGYSGGFVGPIIIGYTLDLAGGMSRLAWGVAFGLVAVLMLAALAMFQWMRPRELAGDRGAK